MKNLFLVLYSLCVISLTSCFESEAQDKNSKEVMIDKSFEKLKQLYPEAQVSLLAQELFEPSLNNLPCRPPSNNDPNCIEYQLLNIPVDMNGCTVLCSVNIRECTNAGKVYYVGFWGFSYTFASNDPDCWTWVANWSNLYNGQNIKQVEDAMNQFYRDLSLKFEKQILSTKILDIPTFPNYGNIGEWYEADCKQLCTTADDSSGEIIWLLSNVKCGDACCRRITAYSQLPNQQIDQITVEANPVGDPVCEPVTIICNGSGVQQFNCKFPCERI